MSLINYTGSITLRQTKGSALTFQELDTNFNYLNSGSIIGTYLPYSEIQPLLLNNGDGFGNVIVGQVSPNMAGGGIIASQLVTLDVASPPNPNELNFVTASVSNSGSFLGVALETKNPGEPIKILTEGYYSVYSSGSTGNGYLIGSSTIAGSSIYFSGSFATLTKPGTAALTRPLGFCLNTQTNPNEIKYIKFSPSSHTLG